MNKPVKCWMKTVEGEEGEVILDSRLARYLDFGLFSHGSGMEWPQEEEDPETWVNPWVDDEECLGDEAEEPVFLSVIFHDGGGVTADGAEVVEHRGVPDWAFNGGMPAEGGIS